jgi:hypothetical protein
MCGRRRGSRNLAGVVGKKLDRSLDAVPRVSSFDHQFSNRIAIFRIAHEAVGIGEGAGEMDKRILVRPPRGGVPE